MPRRGLAVAQTQSIVASAQSYQSPKDDAAARKARGGENWQRAGWDFFDTVSSFHQGCTISGSLLSRAKLIPLFDGKPTDDVAANQAIEQLYGGPEGQVDLLRQWGVHASVAGEGWIFAPTGVNAAPQDWIFAAATEVGKSGGAWKVEGEMVDGMVPMRIWRSHPRRRKYADAPTRSILPHLAELLQLQKRIAAQIDSRLSGAGLVLLPSETEFPAVPTTQLNYGDPQVARTAIAPKGAQGMADLLKYVASVAIQRPESAEAMIPIIAMAPGEHIDKVKHINFWSELDKVAPKLRAELIGQIAIGLDVPAEILLGSAGSNHWNMWLSDENSVKVHAEPTLRILTSGLTQVWMWPGLEQAKGLDHRRYTIGVDTSQMRLRPNRSKEALELYDRQVLGEIALLRENGFTEGDLMTAEDTAKALLRKTASGSTTPELVAAALAKLGADLGIQVSDHREPAEARPDRSLAEHPVRALPERPASQPAALDGVVLAAEQIVDRALQRAGNRLKVKLALKNPVVAANRLYTVVSVGSGDLDDVLQDAWSACSEFDYGVDGAKLARALDIYTRSLMLSQKTPSRVGIRAALTLLLDRPAA